MKSLSARGLVPACVLSAAMLAACALPGAASATTVGPKCSSTSAISGQGSTLQEEAQKLWNEKFNISGDPHACNGTQGSKDTPAVTYLGTGSGKGLRTWGASIKSESEYKGPVPTNAFLGTDEPPNRTQIKEIEARETTIMPESVETIPVLEGAVAVVVNLPNGCLATSTSNKGRLVFNQTTLEGIYRGTITKWSQIKDNGDALSQTKVKGAPTCNPEQTIVPFVRKDGSGTTHIFKRVLNLINPAKFETEKGEEKSWGEVSEGSENTTWPKGVVTLEKGEGSAVMASSVAETPSSLAYVNLADARSNGSFSNKTIGGPKLQKFWVPIQNSPTAETYADPSSNKDAEKKASADCAGEQYSNGSAPFPPPSVTSPWDEVTTKLTETKYVLCGFTYVVTLNAYSAFGSAANLEEATTVNGYLQFVLSTGKEGGQTEIKNHDYLGLPKGTVIAEARNGAERVAF